MPSDTIRMSNILILKGFNICTSIRAMRGAQIRVTDSDMAALLSEASCTAMNRAMVNIIRAGSKKVNFQWVFFFANVFVSHSKAEKSRAQVSRSDIAWFVRAWKGFSVDMWTVSVCVARMTSTEQKMMKMKLWRYWDKGFF